jgi:uncharacterized protein YlzI (FlbEa/FlbD family)
MLVRLTDIKGQPVWVNPIHVRAVRAKSKYTEVIVPLNTAMGQSVVKVKESVDEVVETLNAGMPEILPPLPPDDDGGSGGGLIGGAGSAALMG